MSLPRPLSVAIQGERGAFSEEAARMLFRVPFRTVSTRNFSHMFSSVSHQASHVCLAPMENSLIGTIHPNYDLLTQYHFRIRGEVYLRVSHCLIAPIGTYLEDVDRVYSHPIALDQCQEFFRRHPKVETISTYDTAGSVRMLVEDRVTTAAAIAGRAAAEYYGAKILREHLEDDPANYTRFFLLSRDDETLDGLEAALEPAVIGPEKTSLVFYVKSEPGALYHALSAFADRGIDLAKIESRPVRGRPFEYLFYLDFEGSPWTSPGAEAVAELEHRASYVQVLGTYPAGRLAWSGGSPAPGSSA